ncbi:MAG TPA: hypothetical protein VGT41_03200 [Candidatus Babeliales bacterium]|nr:hypothetical protein [Candidatus Babeliales bacterium]
MMNKQTLLTVFAILCSGITNNTVATDFKFLSEDAAEYLIDNAARAKVGAYRAQRKMDTGRYNQADADKAQQRAAQAVQTLIEFGNQAEAAKQTNDPQHNLAGRTSAKQLLTELKTTLLESRQELIETTKKNIKAMQEANLNITAISKDLAFYEAQLETIENDFKDKIKDTSNSKTSLGTSFTQHIKSFITNKWTKLAAGILIACAVCKFVYNRYNQPNESSDEENDDE